LKDCSKSKKQFVLDSWKSLDAVERFIFNKLLGGSFRIGYLLNPNQYDSKILSAEATAVAHSIMEDWNPLEMDFDALIKGEYTNTNLSKPYPFVLLIHWKKIWMI
jgi:DNA ligase-1